MEKPAEKSGKTKKKMLFGFGKKKADDSVAPKQSTFQSASSDPAPTSAASAASSSYRRSTTSPTLAEYPNTMMPPPSSPGRGLYSSSPRLASPAGSQIFERDVQESVPHLPNSPNIPSHIQTENLIPPVLDASSEAITDDHLDPDSVEIITHAHHQPAAAAVAGAVYGPVHGDSVSGHWPDELVDVDSASNYGSLDTTDVRRLSFISFADVVQAEHAHAAGGYDINAPGNRHSMSNLVGLTSLASMSPGHRSPSPMRSPVSSQGGGAAGGQGTSPPTSKSGSVKGLDLSPGRRSMGSPGTTASSLHGMAVPGSLSLSLSGLSQGPTQVGELNIETMSQALRRTGSADLGGVRSLPNSPIEGPGSR